MVKVVRAENEQMAMKIAGCRPELLESKLSTLSWATDVKSYLRHIVSARLLLAGTV